MTGSASAAGRHRVVIVGGGFGGLRAARALKRAPVEVTLIDRRNYHLFQPLLYQVATGSLSPGEIASPLRGLLKRQRNARVVMAEVDGFDLEARTVKLGQKANGEPGGDVPYDTLVVAAGATHSYFGRQEWEQEAPGLKRVEDALRIRRRMLRAFEAAEVETDPERLRGWLTFVVIGAGPTGVEMAGQFAEIGRYTLRRDFRSIDPSDNRVLLIEATDKVLRNFGDKLADRGEKGLRRLGVEPLLNTMVTDIDDKSVTYRDKDGKVTCIPARTVVWAAGVAASPLAKALADATGSEVDRAGRLDVGPDLTLPGHPEIFAIGDMVNVLDAEGNNQNLPGVAQPAMQEGVYAARLIADRLRGKDTSAVKPFKYKDKGSMATIGRKLAVADVKNVKFDGFFAWLLWLVVHIMFLVGLENRVIVFMRWTTSFLTRGRAQRLITGEEEAGEYAPEPARQGRERVADREPSTHAG